MGLFSIRPHKWFPKPNCFHFTCSCPASIDKYGIGLPNQGFLWSDRMWKRHGYPENMLDICPHLFTVLKIFEINRIRTQETRCTNIEYSVHNSGCIGLPGNTIDVNVEWLKKRGVQRDTLFDGSLEFSSLELSSDDIIDQSKWIASGVEFIQITDAPCDLARRPSYMVKLHQKLWSCNCADFYDNGQCEHLIIGKKHVQHLQERRELCIRLASYIV